MSTLALTSFVAFRHLFGEGSAVKATGSCDSGAAASPVDDGRVLPGVASDALDEGSAPVLSDSSLSSCSLLACRMLSLSSL